MSRWLFLKIFVCFCFWGYKNISSVSFRLTLDDRLDMTVGVSMYDWKLVFYLGRIGAVKGNKGMQDNFSKALNSEFR